MTRTTWWGLGLGSLAAIMVVVLVVMWWFLQPANPQDKQTRQFVIAQSETTSQIAAQLTQAGLIKNPLAFKVTVRVEQLDQKLKAGSFDLSPSMSLSQIAQTLGNNPNAIWVTIPEGKRREEVADILTKSKLQAFEATDFISKTASQEGYLFPDTYLFPREASTDLVISTMTTTFDQKVWLGLASQISASGHSLSEIVTMASIVEREAKSYDDMRIVSGILWKRISIGMALQSDVTVEYMHGYDAMAKSWWGASTAADRQSSSPFNSYIVPGLPPHPIANPGLNAIKATLNPVKTDDLFYLSDNQGKIHTARTLAEHDKNIDLYLR